MYKDYQGEPAEKINLYALQNGSLVGDGEGLCIFSLDYYPIAVFTEWNQKNSFKLKVGIIGRKTDIQKLEKELQLSE